MNKQHMIRNQRRMQAGFSLIELMIALVLGLLVVSTAIGIFLSNKQAYMATQGLGRVQESSQVAFELMSRDIREAGGNPCDSALVAGNIIEGGAAATPTGTDWYLAVARPLYGFESGGPTHVANTDVIQVLRPADDIRSLTADTTAGSASATYSPGTPAYTSGAAIMICDMKTLGVFKANGASSISGANGTVSFGAGAGGNACNYFPQPNAGTCAGASTAYQFPKFATLSALEGVRWFVRDPDGNASNGHSLYRQVNGGTAEEVVQGVDDMQVQYLTPSAGYVNASALTTAAAWNEVRAARVTLILRETEVSGTDGTSRQPITRTIENVITLRNRVL
ncbi:PilW family protein [Pseudoxanthomonas sacheonensis]|uniref:Type IV pilus assembly protein PilW n=1 Tax=Pseudoxanthomonas sacheonensis TaxID=443615 RepID=A0ABU1RMS2_9GAMM|nr:PilW family protein [Pseudoxanthomonas sacheonensis]MDR6840074.1 type IV pilus assembly protein PilW [Pseudoxanthomonas sacheonensis]